MVIDWIPMVRAEVMVYSSYRNIMVLTEETTTQLMKQVKCTYISASMKSS